MASVPGVNVTTTTNQYLAPYWVDQVLRDNYFFGKLMSKTKKWNGSQMLFPIKYQKGLASVAFNGYDLLPVTQQPVSVNMTFYPTFKKVLTQLTDVVKFFLIYGEVPNCAFA
jgi:hypothetical protein